MSSMHDRVVADRQVDVIDARARALIDRHITELVKGVVVGDGDPASHTFAAYLDGSTESSPGILYSLDRPLAGDVVIVGKGPLTGRRILIGVISRERSVAEGGTGFTNPMTRDWQLIRGGALGVATAFDPPYAGPGDLPLANDKKLRINKTTGVLEWVDDTGGGGVTAHSALTGLAADDHTQYALDTDLTTHAGAADPHTGYLLESLFDAKGDLISASADNTPAKVTAGADYSRLWTRAGAAAGIEWGVRQWATVLTADQTRAANTSALVDVPGLTLALPAGLTVLTFEWEGFYQSNTATCGIFLSANAGGGAPGMYRHIETAAPSTFVDGHMSAFDGGAATASVDTINADRAFRVYGRITTPTGTLAMRYANEVAVAGNSVKIMAGSILRIWMA